MNRRLALATLVVRDYDEALDFYVKVLGFELLEDTPLTPKKRWVRVAPPGGGGCQLLLARAANARQRRRIGDQTGGRVAFFLSTDDFEGDYANLRAHGVEVVREPRSEPYGRVLVFKDLYGNLWDLIEPVVADS
jgi:catechol 2,3-dioxygenase-like lactoylglutathione lyase family enzyme